MLGTGGVDHLMRRLLPAILLLGGWQFPALAEDWSGKLIDATCNDQQQQQKTIPCDATKATTAFALDVAGKIYKLDPPGNLKAATAMKYRPAPEDPKKINEVNAKVTGTEVSGMILVETIGLQ